ncbi:MAG: type II toxin-antitoxin system MqsA family antitoxin [Blastochloris sp.]|nr:type II toxin-antitoxin system MqsA family antitoxin [Blastochloris sp.]
MSDPSENWEKIEIAAPVYIPTLDGKAIAETVEVKVEAYRNPADGEIYLDGHALKKLEDAKARYMGLLTPEEILDLRERLDMTQEKISELFQIGKKTWSRWENGRERPSRSLNLLLHALNDGKVDINYLTLMANPALRRQPIEAHREGQVRRTFAFRPEKQAHEEPIVRGG